MQATGHFNLGFIHKSLNQLDVKVHTEIKRSHANYTVEAFYDTCGNEFNPGKSLEIRVKRHVKNNPSKVFPKGTKAYKKLMKLKNDGSSGLYNRGGSTRGEGF